jgi:glutamate formiminotransferase/formiminotetrahydrofolate cyclodeaminase
MKIIECVPNFSEGRDKSVIDQITGEIEGVDGAKLLNVEMDADYNRTVVTFVGSPDNVADAAFRATKKAAELIDMTQHKGEHPRMGATDVVPFIPVAGVTMDECVAASLEYAKRAGEELGIPMYLYEFSAKKAERKNLAVVRKGQYEALEEKLKQEEWTPDFGPAEFNARAGGTVTGARKFLIAYNVNLNTAEVQPAKVIAENIRESGKLIKDENGNKVMDENGKAKRIPGSLKAVKGMGFLLEAHNIAQVSMNLVDYETTPVHIAYEECRKEAEKLGVRVTGSEIVGLVPKNALMLAGNFYLERKGEDQSGADEKLVIDTAIQEMGLSDLHEFDPRTKVIEYMV